MNFKFTIPLYICLFLCISATGYSQTVYDTVKVDFGSSLSEGIWNNMTDGTGAGEISMLKNNRDLLTGMSLNVYDRFNGINTGGTTTPDASIGFPSTATSDSYFGNTATFGGNTEPTGGILISGLNPDKEYVFEVFASRSASDNREAKYKFVGATSDSANLNPSSNTANTVSVTLNPAADGTIDLIVSPGPNNDNGSGFYYLGAFTMTYEQEEVLPPSITLTDPDGGEELTGETNYSISWDPINLVEDVVVSYSTNNGDSWSEIETVNSAQTSLIWNVPNVNSGNSLVQVASGSVSDQSDAVFTIIPSTGIVYDTVNVDFGSDISMDGWNNFTDNTGMGELPALKNSKDLYTGIGAAIFDRFNGINLNGTTTPNASLALPSTATSDSYYGNTALWGGSVQPTAGISFTGLNPSKQYTFEVFASRMGVSDNRETKYKFIGDVTDSLYLNPANNDSEVVSITLQPAIDGSIDLLVSAGENNDNSYNFYYLNTLKILYEQDESSSSLVVLSPNGNEVFIKGTEQEITWASNDIDNVNIEYSANNGASWNLISTVDATLGTYTWTIPSINTDSALVRVASVENSELSDVSNSVFRIDDPISGEFGPVIVVLGSSTAAGSGASSPDSAWVSRYRSYVQSLNPDTYVVNLAVGGYNSYDIMPSDFTQPSGRPAPETENNITKALTYNPWAIIVNLPSNDAASNFSIEEQVFNMKLIAQTATDVDVPVWVTTTQPRNFSESQRDNLIEMRDSILAIFGDRTIRIFDQLANEDGTIIEAYNSGDGVHLNNAGHKIISDEIIEQEVWEIISALNTSNTDEPLHVPTAFAIKNNYPNPFNPSTSIEFSVPISSSIDIRVYDITGREVSVLTNNVYSAGTHSVIWDATSFATGMYIYRITARGSDNTLFSKSMKMMLIK